MSAAQRTFLQGLSEYERNALLLHAEGSAVRDQSTQLKDAKSRGVGGNTDGGGSRVSIGSRREVEDAFNAVYKERDRRQQLEAQVAALQAKIHDQNGQIDALRVERDAMRQNLQRNDDRGTRLAAQLSSLEQENASLSAKLVAANNDRAQLQTKNDMMQTRVLELQQGYISMANLDGVVERRDLIRRSKIGGLLSEVAASGALDADLQQMVAHQQRQSQAKVAFSTIAALTRERDTLQQRLQELSERLADSVSREAATRGTHALRCVSWKRSAVQAEARLAVALKRVKELNEEIRKRDGAARQREKYMAQLERTIMAQHKSLQQLRRLLEKGMPGGGGAALQRSTREAAAPTASSEPAQGADQAPAPASPNGRGAGCLKTGRPERSGGDTVRFQDEDGLASDTAAPASRPERPQQQLQKPPSQLYNDQYPNPFLQYHSGHGQPEFGVGRSGSGEKAYFVPPQHADGSASHGRPAPEAAAGLHSAGGAESWVGRPVSPSRRDSERPLAQSADGVAPRRGGRVAWAEGDAQFEAPSLSPHEADGEEGLQDDAPRAFPSSLTAPVALSQQLSSMEANLAQLYRDLEAFKDSSLHHQALHDKQGTTRSPHSSPQRRSFPSSPISNPRSSSPAHYYKELGDETDPERVPQDLEDSGGEGSDGAGATVPFSPTAKGVLRSPTGSQPVSRARTDTRTSSPTAGYYGVEERPGDEPAAGEQVHQVRQMPKLRGYASASAATRCTGRSSAPRVSPRRYRSDTSAMQQQQPKFVPPASAENPAVSSGSLRAMAPSGTSPNDAFASIPREAQSRRYSGALRRIRRTPEEHQEQQQARRDAASPGAPPVDGRSSNSSVGQEQWPYHGQQPAPIAGMYRDGDSSRRSNGSGKWQHPGQESGADPDGGGHGNGNKRSSGTEQWQHQSERSAHDADVSREGGSSNRSIESEQWQHQGCRPDCEPVDIAGSLSKGNTCKDEDDRTSCSSFGSGGASIDNCGHFHDGPGVPSTARQPQAATARRDTPGPEGLPAKAETAVTPEAVECDDGAEEHPLQPLPTHMLGHLLRCTHHHVRGYARGGVRVGGPISPLLGRIAGRGGGGINGGIINIQRPRATRPVAAPGHRPVTIAAAARGDGTTRSPPASRVVQPNRGQVVVTEDAGYPADVRDHDHDRAMSRRSPPSPTRAAVFVAGGGRPSHGMQPDRGRVARAPAWVPGGRNSRSRSPVEAAAAATTTAPGGSGRDHHQISRAASPVARAPDAMERQHSAAAPCTRASTAAEGSPRGPSSCSGMALSPISTLLACIMPTPKRPVSQAAPSELPSDPQKSPHQRQNVHDDTSSSTDQGNPHRHNGNTFDMSTYEVLPGSSSSGSNCGGRTGAKRRQHDEGADNADDRRKAQGSSNGGTASATCTDSQGDAGSGTGLGSSSGSRGSNSTEEAAVGWRPMAGRISGSQLAERSRLPVVGPVSPQSRALPVPAFSGASNIRTASESDSASLASTSKGAYCRPTLAGWLGDSGPGASESIAMAGHPAVSAGTAVTAEVSRKVEAEGVVTSSADSHRQQQQQQQLNGRKSVGSPIAEVAATAASALQKLRDQRLQRMHRVNSSAHQQPFHGSSVAAAVSAASATQRPRPQQQQHLLVQPGSSGMASARGDDDGGVVVLALRGSLQGEVIVSPSRLVSPGASSPLSPGSPTGKVGAAAGGGQHAPGSGGRGGNAAGQVTMRLEIGGGPPVWRAATATTAAPPAAGGGAELARGLQPATAAEWSLRDLRQGIRPGSTGRSAYGELQLDPSRGSSVSRGYMTSAEPSFDRSASSLSVSAGSSGANGASNGWPGIELVALARNGHGLRTAQNVVGTQGSGVPGAWGGQHVAAAPAPPVLPLQHPLMRLLGQASEDLQLLSDRLKPLVDARPAFKNSLLASCILGFLVVLFWIIFSFFVLIGRFFGTLPLGYGVMLGSCAHTGFFSLLAGLVLQTHEVLADNFRKYGIWSSADYQTYLSTYAFNYILCGTYLLLFLVLAFTSGPFTKQEERGSSYTVKTPSASTPPAASGTVSGVENSHGFGVNWPNSYRGGNV
ncbi:hypothetical protein VOLCADRAFT_104502 [Volvox carteri f. nagariensis]|uniref:Uncharacterized protein n=1 Tax=Volvox carteri f. nagariensis TaxID=3068 RepID=D8TU11_VOLCA|nr:uncharacterized protein VOLCADRAFT_104502 [Volvox carteri f. nagariensis]EFJ49063.1 hypothetical protein VOLCADRAFT_104502 [Volvox carteri f. nagariensis]|eukprot:XP_002949960.1 hypothetical protein VOLCADRAFT_104502 [Volvox carteri f. nagariensis]